MASTLTRISVRRRGPRPANQPAGLPHPSWRRAVGGWPEPHGAEPASAVEFWERLGL